MNKFERAQQILTQINVDGWLIICNEDSDINSRFMLGVASHARNYVYVAQDGNHVVLAVEMEAPMIQNSLIKKNINANVLAYKSSDDLKTKLKKILGKHKIALNFGENVLDYEGTAYADYLRVGDFFSIKQLSPKSEFVSSAPIIYDLRSVKSPTEQNDLRNTCKATIEILESVPNWVKLGMTERDLRAKIEYEYMKLGKPSFDTIVGTGVHSADPHHNTSTKKIEPGVLLIDTGLQTDEMCSDITWTFWIGKNPPEKFMKAYMALYEAKKVANQYYIDGIKNNIPAKKCRECLAELGYDHEKLFFHGLGHSLGFEAHDIGMRISHNVPDNFMLKEHMVYTNEPGLYWQGEWGIRLEDDVIIGKRKCEQVTKVPSEPILI
ncbi:MAG: aminopeptidase P family protein [Promethearchaeota archaeon]|nr:MAG: aminopeptidase P family protein [Candidatus Lokiarchaeota archaeon]